MDNGALNDGSLWKDYDGFWVDDVYGCLVEEKKAPKNNNHNKNNTKNRLICAYGTALLYIIQTATSVYSVAVSNSNISLNIVRQPPLYIGIRLEKYGERAGSISSGKRIR